MAKLVDDPKANKQLLTIKRLVEAGFSDDDIACQMQDIGETNLQTDAVLWTGKSVRSIRENFNLSPKKDLGILGIILRFLVGAVMLLVVLYFLITSLGETNAPADSSKQIYTSSDTKSKINDSLEVLKQPALKWKDLSEIQKAEACETIIYRGKVAGIFNTEFIEAIRLEADFYEMQKEICDGLDAALNDQEATKLNDSIESIATILMAMMGWTK